MSKTNARPHDPRLGIQALVFLDGFVRLFIWSSSIALSIAVFTACDAWPRHPIQGADLSTAWLWGQKLTHLVLLYNVFYVAHLVVFRLPIPTPKEGRYEIGPGKKLDRQLIYSALIGVLTKARLKAPFPGFLVFHIANLPPMRWLMGPIFGPRSRSCYVTDPIIADPHLVTIGRNVVVGFDAAIGAHYQDRESVVIKRSVIEDDVVIGAMSQLNGVHVKRGAVIGGGAVLLPGSVVGENEYWAGNPARRRRVLPPPGEREEVENDVGV
ncbi:MAG: hypothetical protein JXQ75_18590 [Phycisphaerae bacterium]|nr:hypothetical protein [Phycisphaerae bacterium]